MGKIIDLTGKVYGRLTVISRDGLSKSGKVRWYCLCVCGAHKTILGEHIITQRTISCGCFARENANVNNSTHKMSKSKEYAAWIAIHQRCYNPKTNSYNNYGGRGITVCARWLASFADFLYDMGFAPSKHHSIERIDNDKGYSPENCKWATAKEQANNRRSSKRIEYNGQTKTVSEWADFLNVSYATVSERYRRNKTLTPYRVRKQKREYISLSI